MKKTLLITGLLLALTASLAAAAGLNLSWNDCGAAGTQNRNFACNTNVGNNILIASFVAPTGLTEVTGNEVVIDLQTSGAVLAPWWEMKTGSCRAASSLASSVDFTVGPFTCYDYWQGGAVSGHVEDLYATGPNTARIKLVVALPAGSPLITAIPAGLEVYSCKFTINNAKSTGLGACAGCFDGACIVLNSIRITQTPVAPGGNKFLSNPDLRNWVTWQGGGVALCPEATPAKNRTWGSVKSLYR